MSRVIIGEVVFEEGKTLPDGFKWNRNHTLAYLFLEADEFWGKWYPKHPRELFRSKVQEAGFDIGEVKVRKTTLMGDHDKSPKRWVRNMTYSNFMNM